MFLCTAQFSKAIHFALFHSHIEHSTRDYSNINQILSQNKILITLEIFYMEYNTIQKRITMNNLKLVLVISHLKLSQIQFSLATTDQNTILLRLYVHKNNRFLFVLHSIHNFSSFPSSCFPPPPTTALSRKALLLRKGKASWRELTKSGKSS